MVLTYTELARLPTFEERYEYCRLSGVVGQETFGFDRYLNQMLYSSPKWKSARRQAIIRDNGCDLAFEGRPIGGKIFVHHLNPITEDDIEHERDSIFDPEFLVCVSPSTHNAIHYGDATLLVTPQAARYSGDMCPWKQ